jgi:hypothetical protein
MPMEWVIHVEWRLAGQVLHWKEVTSITRMPRHTRSGPEHVGLTLGDGKTVLSALQRATGWRMVSIAGWPQPLVDGLGRA